MDMSQKVNVKKVAQKKAQMFLILCFRITVSNIGELIKLQTWSHFAICRTENQLALYIDGVLSQDNFTSGALENGQVIENGDSISFIGGIKRLQIYCVTKEHCYIEGHSF